MAKDLLEEVRDEVLAFGKDIAKGVIKSGEEVAGIESKEEGQSAILTEIKKILPKNPLE